MEHEITLNDAALNILNVWKNKGMSERFVFALLPDDFNLSAYNIPINNYNNNKKIADISYCTSGILSRIIYPAKGFSVFEYELNKDRTVRNTGEEPAEEQLHTGERGSAFGQIQSCLSRRIFRHDIRSRRPSVSAI